jgi:phage/plasmid-like protein (TIGR03299 family)
MSHEIETAMYTKVEAWHKLGNVLQNFPTTEEAFQASGLVWDVRKMPLFMEVEAQNLRVRMDTKMFALARNTDARILGYCMDAYEIYQNKDAFGWTHPLVESGYWTYESAGSMKKGEICWVLLKQSEVQLIPNDKLKQYLLCTWSHSGSMSNQVMPTTIRVVCNNTLQMALREGGATKIRHTRNIIPKMEEVKAIYGLSQQMFVKQTDTFKELIDAKVTDLQLEAICEKLYPLQMLDEKTATKYSVERLADVKRFVVGGQASGNRALGIQNTGYGALMALTEYNEHIAGGNRVKDRGYNILFNGGKEANQDAFAVVANAVNKGYLIA